jgi:hypothetical protein
VITELWPCRWTLNSFSSPDLCAILAHTDVITHPSLNALMIIIYWHAFQCYSIVIIVTVPQVTPCLFSTVWSVCCDDASGVALFYYRIKITKFFYCLQALKLYLENALYISPCITLTCMAVMCRKFLCTCTQNGCHHMAQFCFQQCVNCCWCNLSMWIILCFHYIYIWCTCCLFGVTLIHVMLWYEKCNLFVTNYRLCM